MRNATVLLVGPNKLSRAGLRSLFDGSHFKVVGEIANFTAASVPGAIAAPDVALVEMPDETTAVLDVLERLEAVYPDTPIVILHETVSMAMLAACLAAGASGFLTKDITPDALLRSLELVVLGETVFPTHLARLLAEGIRQRQAPEADDGEYGLSLRETEILQCLLRGESNKLIAHRLHITEATIKVHIKSVLRKIKVTNRTQAAIWAHRRGYLPAGDAVLRTGGPAL
jgi:two-component system, NarL family, nitrate/nitrite response regulator NarL